MVITQNTVSTLYHEENGNKQSAIGSNDHSALAVNNTDYYVPGFYSSWGTTSAFAPIKGFATQESAYAESTKLKGLVKVTGGDTSSLDETNRVFDVTPVARVEEYYLSEVNPAVRFAVFDTAESRSFTVENTNATLFDTLINAKKISEDNDGLGDWKYTVIKHVNSAPLNFKPGQDETKQKLDNYNSFVRVGNVAGSSLKAFGSVSIKIEAIAVGDRFVIAADDQGNLHIID